MTPRRSEPEVKPANQIRDFDEWNKSLRNFDWVGDAIPGGSDLDFIVERKGHFLIIEGKAWQKGVSVPYGQHLLLYRLSRLPSMRVYLVGEDGEKLHLLHYNDAPKPVIRRYGSVTAWWAPERFIPTDRAGLRTILRAWWEDSSS